MKEIHHYFTDPQGKKVLRSSTYIGDELFLHVDCVILPLIKPGTKPSRTKKRKRV